MWVEAHRSGSAAEATEGIGSPGSGVTDTELPNVVAGNGIQVLVTPEPSLQSQVLCLK